MSFEATKIFRTNGAALHYVERGTGPPVVLVHGGVSDLRTWAEPMDTLATGFRVVAYSRRYARPNEDIPESAPDPIERHVEDLETLLENHVGEAAHLVGHSWGALIVLLLCLRKPGLARSMTLIEPPAITLFVDIPPKPLPLLRLFLTAPGTALAILRFGATVIGPAEKAFRRDDDEKALEIFGKGVLGPERFAGLSKERYDQVWQNRKTDKAQILGSAFPALDRDAIAKTMIPALLLTGSRSPAVFHKVIGHLDALLPLSRLVRIENASHIVHEDAPDAFDTALGDFLKSH